MIKERFDTVNTSLKQIRSYHIYSIWVSGNKTLFPLEWR